MGTIVASIFLAPGLQTELEKVKNTSQNFIREYYIYMSLDSEKVTHLQCDLK